MIPAELLGGTPGDHIASDNLAYVPPERPIAEMLCYVLQQISKPEPEPPPELDAG